MTATEVRERLEKVTEALEADTSFDIEDLSVSQAGDDGAVTIDGRVADIAAKRRAAARAYEAAAGRFAVAERLRVAVREEGELALRDELLRLLSSESLFRDFTLTVAAGSHREVVHQGTPEGGRIELQVDDATVRLSGTVPSLGHRRFAEVLCWWAPGCERVDNALSVVPPEEDSDEELSDAVRMVLEKDPLVDATQLTVGTAGGVVELRGLVSSEEQRRLAVNDAWYVPGVWSVRDRLEARARG